MAEGLRTYGRQVTLLALIITRACYSRIACKIQGEITNILNTTEFNMKFSG